MKNVNVYILITAIMIFSSCKEECEDGFIFFDECIENNSNHLYQADYENASCEISFLFDIVYGEQIDAYKYQYSHSHDPRVTWTVAKNVEVGQYLNGGATCELDGDFGDEITQCYFHVPDEDAQAIPVLLKRFNRFTYETLDSTVIVFDRK